MEEIEYRQLIIDRKDEDIFNYIKKYIENNDFENLKNILKACNWYMRSSHHDYKILLKYYKIIIQKYFEDEEFADYILGHIINYRFLYYDYSLILKRVLTWKNEKALNLCSTIIRNKVIPQINEKTISKNESSKLINLFIKSYRDDFDESIRTNYFVTISQYPLPKQCELFLKKIIIDTDNIKIFNEAMNSYGNLVQKNPEYLDNFITLLKPNYTHFNIDFEWFIRVLEGLAKSDLSEKRFLLVNIQSSLLRNRDFLLNPEIRNGFLQIKYDYLINRDCPIILSLIREILSETNLQKPHYGWYYERYLSLEKSFINLIQYIPITNSLSKPNFKFGSPEISLLHIQIGTMIDSIIKTHFDLLNQKFDDQIKCSGKFSKDINKLNEIYNLNNIKLKIKNFTLLINPYNKILNENPSWYSIYSKYKHNIVEMEEKTNLKLLIESMGAFYTLIVLHPDNWQSIEYDWDSKIFDKYSLTPLIDNADFKI